MPLFSSPKAQGEWAEVCFLLHAISLGCTISRPFGDNSKYDFIVDCRRSLLRVQVKSVMTLQEGFYQFQTSSGSACKKPYSPADIDFIAACVIPEMAWYIVPVRALRGRKTIRVSPHRSARCFFERFREAWHFLCPGALYE